MSVWVWESTSLVPAEWPRLLYRLGQVQKNLDNPIGLALPKGLACNCCVAPGSTAVTKRYSRRIRPKLDRACVS
jgi:hypothetical protein